MRRFLKQEFAASRAMWRLQRLHPVAIPAVAAAGVLAALAETFAFLMFIPLWREVIGGPALGGTNPLARIVAGLFDAVPADDRLVVLCIVVFAAMGAKAALGFAYASGQQWVVARVGHALRTRLYAVGLHGEFERFSRGRAGAFSNLVARESERVADAVGSHISLAVARATVFLFVVVLVVLSWQLTLLVVAAFLIHYALVRRLIRRSRALSRLQRRHAAKLSHMLEQTAVGMRTIRDFGREDDAQSRFDRLSAAAARGQFRAGLVIRALIPLSDMLGLALVIAILAAGLRDPASFSSFIVFIFVLHRTQPMSRQAVASFIELTGATASVEQVLGHLDQRAASAETRGVVPNLAAVGDIRFESVSHRYEASEGPALESVTFTLPRGRTTALVGPSGSGKSTVVNLLMRLYTPEAGAILVGGTALSDLDRIAWRKRIALVRQDIFLFEASILDNIAYGKPGASRAEVVEAARLAHADRFIEQLPQGYDTVIGARGLQLSGGQRQRVTLARALICDPEILILDEATNALDAASERIIQDALNELAGGRTVLVIAHRATAIEQADHMVVLEAGRVVYEGAPDRRLEAAAAQPA